MPLELCALPAAIAAATLAGSPSLIPLAQSRAVHAVAQAGATTEIHHADAPDFAAFDGAVGAEAASSTSFASAAAGQISTIGPAEILAVGYANSTASRGPGAPPAVSASGESTFSTTFELAEPALITLSARVEAVRALPGSDVAAEIRLAGPGGDIDWRLASLKPVGEPELFAADDRADASVLPPGVYTLTAAARATATATPEKSAGAVFQLVLTVAPAPVCRGDLNGDGAVDAADIAQLISKWNMRFRATDLNGDGVTNAQDLCIILGAWGPCPG